jgi:hypothetical protein
MPRLVSGGRYNEGARWLLECASRHGNTCVRVGRPSSSSRAHDAFDRGSARLQLSRILQGSPSRMLIRGKGRRLGVSGPGVERAAYGDGVWGLPGQDEMHASPKGYARLAASTAKIPFRLKTYRALCMLEPDTPYPRGKEAAGAAQRLTGSASPWVSTSIAGDVRYCSPNRPRFGRARGGASGTAEPSSLAGGGPLNTNSAAADVESCKASIRVWNVVTELLVTGPNGRSRICQP